MKIKKSKLKLALRKLQFARETLDQVSQAVFVKECEYENMEKIGEWIVEVEGILQKGMLR